MMVIQTQICVTLNILEPPESLRPKRVAKLPEKFKDFVMQKPKQTQFCALLEFITCQTLGSDCLYGTFTIYVCLVYNEQWLYSVEILLILGFDTVRLRKEGMQCSEPELTVPDVIRYYVTAIHHGLERVSHLVV